MGLHALRLRALGFGCFRADLAFGTIAKSWVAFFRAGPALTNFPKPGLM